MRIVSVLVMLLTFLAGCGNTDHKAAMHDPSHPLEPMDSTKFTTIQWLDSVDKNFGKIPEGKKLEVAYRFRNAGDIPLIIQRVQPSCGCTVAEQPTEPVMPGQEGTIKASFNSEGRVGQNHKTLFVYANTKVNQSHELKFEVEVEKKKW